MNEANRKISKSNSHYMVGYHEGYQDGYRSAQEDDPSTANQQVAAELRPARESLKWLEGYDKGRKDGFVEGQTEWKRKRQNRRRKCPR